MLLPHPLSLLQSQNMRSLDDEAKFAPSGWSSVSAVHITSSCLLSSRLAKRHTLHFMAAIHEALLSLTLLTTSFFPSRLTMPSGLIIVRAKSTNGPLARLRGL